MQATSPSRYCSLISHSAYYVISDNCRERYDLVVVAFGRVHHQLG